MIRNTLHRQGMWSLWTVISVETLGTTWALSQSKVELTTAARKAKLFIFLTSSMSWWSPNCGRRANFEIADETIELVQFEAFGEWCFLRQAQTFKAPARTKSRIMTWLCGWSMPFGQERIKQVALSKNRHLNLHTHIHLPSCWFLRKGKPRERVLGGGWSANHSIT